MESKDNTDKRVCLKIGIIPLIKGLGLESEVDATILHWAREQGYIRDDAGYAFIKSLFIDLDEYVVKNNPETGYTEVTLRTVIKKWISEHT